MKKCPYCAEEIQDEAVVCRHCGRTLQSVASTQPPSKTDYKKLLKIIGIVFLVLLSITYWYLTIPAVAIWFIWKSPKLKLNQKNKTIATVATALIFIGLGAANVYANRQPSITVIDPKDGTSIQAKSITIKGNVSPKKSTVTIQDQRVPTDSSGTFSYDFPLPKESNAVTIKVENGGKEKDASLSITRIFTDEEKAAQAAEQAARAKAAQDKADQEAKAKAAAEQKAKQEQAAYDNSKAGKLCKAHPDWSKDDCQKIADNMYWIGMTYDMLVVLRGKANNINPSNYGGGTSYQYCWSYYTPSCFYDRNDDGVLDSYN